MKIIEGVPKHYSHCCDCGSTSEKFDFIQHSQHCRGIRIEQEWKECLVCLDSIQYNFPPMPKEIERKLRDLAELKNDWDSYGTPPIDLRAIEHARKVLLVFCDLKFPMPKIYPSNKGGLFLEWNEFDINITEDGLVRVMGEDDE